MLAVRIYSDGYWVYNARTGQHSKFLMLTTLYLWNDNNTTETTFVPSGSTTVASAKSEIEKSRSTVAWSLTSVAWPFRNFFQNVWNVQKTLFDSWPTVAWTPTTVVRPLSDFFRFFPNCLKRLKTLFDSRPTVAWTPTTVAWPFSDFFQKISKLLETCINVVWQSADGRVNSDHCRATVEWLFSKIFQITWNVYERCLTVGRWSRDLRPQLSRDRSATFFKMLPICLKRRKNVVWQSVGRRSHNLQPLMRDRWATFFKISLIAWYIGKTLFESQRTVAWLSGYFATVFVS